MVRGDWFPVSFSSVLFGIGVTVPVGTMVEVAVLPVVKVAGMPVTIFVWITVTKMGVCVGTGVSVTEGVLDGVGEAVAVGVINAKGTAYEWTNPTIGIRTLINSNNTLKNFTAFIPDRPGESIS
jgi:hypothetical protein